jgi:hypothetical protein
MGRPRARCVPDWPPFWVPLDRLNSRRTILSSVAASWRSRSSRACRYTLAARVEEWPMRFISSASEAPASPVSVLPVWRRS